MTPSIHKQRWQRAYRYMGRATDFMVAHATSKYCTVEALFLSLNPVFCDRKKD